MNEKNEKEKENIYEEFVWSFLPQSLKKNFYLEKFENPEDREAKMRIFLTEENKVPDLPTEYQGKKIINTIKKKTTIDYFLITGKKVEIILTRRKWKFEGVEKMLAREIDVRAKGTHLEKEYALFLKELHRKFSCSD